MTDKPRLYYGSAIESFVQWTKKQVDNKKESK